jgi:hypothetical protein
VNGTITQYSYDNAQRLTQLVEEGVPGLSLTYVLSEANLVDTHSNLVGFLWGRKHQDVARVERLC